MITVRYCDWSKKIIDGDETFELKLIDGVSVHSFEISRESYNELLDLLTTKQKFVAKVQPAISLAEPKSEPVLAPAPPQPRQPQEMVADQVILESKVADVATLPALSDPKDKVMALKKLDELNQRFLSSFKKKNEANGVNIKDLTDSEINDRSRGK